MLRELSIFLFCLLSIGCIGYSEKKEIIIDNVARDSTFKKNVNAFAPTVLIMKVTGTIDDTFMIRHIYIPPGNVERRIEYDWYEEDITIEYKAYRAKKGKLIIEYDLQ